VSCIGAIAFLAGMAGLAALPFGVVLLAFRKEWPSSGPPSEFLTLAPFLLAIGGGALSFAAYVERYRRRAALPDPVIPAASRSTLVLVALVVLPGPALAVHPFLYCWLAGVAGQAGSPGGELSVILAPVWMAVMLPSASLAVLATTLAIAGPVGLLVYLGGSRRTGRILLLFWLLQLLLLVSSVPVILHGRLPDAQGERSQHSNEETRRTAADRGSAEDERTTIAGRTPGTIRSGASDCELSAPTAEDRLAHAGDERRRPSGVGPAIRHRHRSGNRVAVAHLG
jgi:hypothetical protein